MKKIFSAIFFLITSKVLAVNICVFTTKAGDPFSTAKQDCSHVAGGAANVSAKLTTDHLLFLYNQGFTVVSVANVADSGTATTMVYTLKRD